MADYRSSPIEPDMTWGSGLPSVIPKLKLCGLEGNVIEVTMEWHGVPWKTLRWELTMSGRNPTLVALGEVNNHVNNQDASDRYAMSATPAMDVGMITDTSLHPATTLPNPRASPANQYSYSFGRMPNDAPPGTTWAGHAFKETEYFENVNYTTEKQSGEGGYCYSFPQDDLTSSTPRSMATRDSDNNKTHAKSKGDKKKRH